MLNLGLILAIYGEDYILRIKKSSDETRWVYPFFGGDVTEFEIPLIFCYYHSTTNPNNLIISVLNSAAIDYDGNTIKGDFLLKDILNLEFTKIEYLTKAGDTINLMNQLSSDEIVKSQLLYFNLDFTVSTGDHLLIEGSVNMKNQDTLNFSYEYELLKEKGYFTTDLRIMLTPE